MLSGTSAICAAVCRKACRLDVVAFKPGNVSILSPGHGMQARDFLRSAVAAAPYLCAPGAAVGQRVLGAITATRAVVDCNTNLGIVLLLAPLMAAAERVGSESGPGQGSLRASLAAVLGALDEADSRDVFAAIRLAAPAGLGSVAGDDVHGAPSAALREIMAQADDYDLIARQYTSDYAAVFELGVPTLRHFRQSWSGLSWATTMCFLVLGSEWPDSHVGRKFGAVLAEDTRKRLAAVANPLKACENPRFAMAELEQLDGELKTRGVNPGTSADLTVASLAALLLTERLQFAR